MQLVKYVGKMTGSKKIENLNAERNIIDQIIGLLTGIIFIFSGIDHFLQNEPQVML